MKKSKKEVLRLQNLIENDRLKINGDFEELVMRDIDKILKEYFDYKNMPQIAIVKNNGKYKINISVCSTRIKSFGVMPKQ